MKYKWSKRGDYLTVTLTLTRYTSGRIWLVWRDGNETRKIELGDLVADEPKILTLELASLSAVHHLLIDCTVGFYTRYIPSKYLNLSSEHD